MKLMVKGRGEGSIESKTPSPLMAPPLLPLFIMLMLVLIPNPIPQSHARFTPKAEDLVTSQSVERPACDGRWIHIRSLPASFNTELLETCDAFPLMDEPLCPYATNHGLGPRTHNRSRSWYRTDPRLLEPLIHRRLMEHPCLTPDPSLADAIFLPYYASLDALPFLYSPPLFNSSALHALPLYHHLLSDQPHVYSRRHGHDHFLVLAGPAWDFSQAPDADPVLWGTSFLSRPEFFNLTVLTLESRPSPWQEHAIPHPTSFHPATLARLDAWLARARRSRRTTLMLFAGGGGGGGANIRGSIRAECENRTDLCQMVDCSDGVCSHDPIRFMRPMLRSSFCLQPPGDTPTRRSTFDGILAGCIPVFFEEISARKQYGWHLPRDRYEDFSVYVPKEDVVYGGVRITQVLSAIPEAEVRRMRERLLELAPGVMYRRHGSSAGLRAIKDAVDLAIDGVFRRIRRRVRALESRQLVVVDDAEEDGDDGWMDGSDLYGLR